MLPTEDIYLPLSEFVNEGAPGQESVSTAHLIIAVVIWIVILCMFTILVDGWIKRDK